MKHMLYLTIIALFVLYGCGKKNEGKKDEGKKDEKTEVVKDDAFKDLKYGGEMGIDDWKVNNSLDKFTGDNNFVGSAFMLAISINDKDTSLYEETKDKLKDKYPMKIYENPSTKEYSAWVLMPNYIMVNINGLGTTSGGLKEYDNPEMMKKLLAMFDFDGLSKLPRENLKGNDLVKFMPEFETIPQK